MARILSGTLRDPVPRYTRMLRDPPLPVLKADGLQAAFGHPVSAAAFHYGLLHNGDAIAAERMITNGRARWRGQRQRGSVECQDWPALSLPSPSCSARVRSGVGASDTVLERDRIFPSHRRV
ncbi:MAG: hypothetical protein OXU20_15255 [Myxococcales bacterium]|nr:hypothetical protein [Myxococcales bacterium]